MPELSFHVPVATARRGIPKQKRHRQTESGYHFNGSDISSPQTQKTHRMDLNNAAIVHAQWRAKFRAAIANAETMDCAVISRDDCCELGKWIYGEAKIQLETKHEFTALLEKHRSFHVEAGKVAKAINARQFEDALEMTGAFTAFGSASATVGLALKALKDAMP